MDVLISSEKLLERFGRQEQQLRRLGLAAQADWIRSAIVLAIKETQEAMKEPPPPIDSST